MEIIKAENTRAGRPAMEGKTRRYTVADDVHEWILQHGGGQYITVCVLRAEAKVL